MLNTLASCLRWRALPAWTVLYREGDPGDSMVFVTDGELVASVRHDDGTDVEVEHCLVGGTLGEMASLDPAPRSATVTAIAPSVVAELSRDALAALELAAPDIASRIVSGVIQAVTRRMRQLEARLEQEILAAPASQPPGASTSPPPAPPPSHPPNGTAVRIGFRSRRTCSGVDVITLQDLRAVAALRDFEDRDLTALLGVARCLPLTAGAVVYQQGEPGRSCIVLVRGEVDILREHRGTLRRVATQKAGSLVGQIALVDRGPRSATVRAATAGEALEVMRDDFEQLLRASSPVAIRFQKLVALAGIRQLRQMLRRVAALPRTTPGAAVGRTPRATTRSPPSASGGSRTKSSTPWPWSPSPPRRARSQRGAGEQPPADAPATGPTRRHRALRVRRHGWRFLFDSLEGALPFDRIALVALEDGDRLVQKAVRVTTPDGVIPSGYRGSLQRGSLAAVIASGKPRTLNRLSNYAAHVDSSSPTHLLLQEGYQASSRRSNTRASPSG